MTQWLTPELKKKVRDLFEPDYKRHLTDNEIEKIAINLTDFMEIYIKFKLRQKYENQKTKS